MGRGLNRKSCAMTSLRIFEKRDFLLGQRYRRIEDQKPRPRLACNLDFAKGEILEPKVKKASKIVEIGRRVEQTSLTQTYHKRGSGGQQLGEFLYFLFLKKIAILMTFGSLLYAKMLEETESEETLGFVVIVFIIGGISIGRVVGHLSTPVTR